MGSLTQCNFCHLRDIRADAKKKGESVFLVRDLEIGKDVDGLNGINVYCPPKGKVTKKEIKNSKKLQDNYSASWMMEIGNRCECD